MKPAPFDYCRPDTLDEALAVLAEAGDEAAILAGGLSMGPMLNMRLARPGVVIDINRIAGLNTLDCGGGRMVTGARLRQQDAMNSGALPKSNPLLAEALPHVGHLQTRSNGTFGGSVAHADPSAEIPLCLVTLNGTVLLQSTAGERSVLARDFFAGALDTARTTEEMIVALEWPDIPKGAGVAFDEFARRRGDFAMAAAAVVAEVDDAGVLTGLSFGLGGVEDRPFIADTDKFLGNKASAELAAEIADAAAEAADPLADIHANRDYRRQLVRAVGARVISRAFERASEREAATC